MCSECSTCTQIVAVSVLCKEQNIRKFQNGRCCILCGTQQKKEKKKSVFKFQSIYIFFRLNNKSVYSIHITMCITNTLWITTCVEYASLPVSSLWLFLSFLYFVFALLPALSFLSSLLNELRSIGFCNDFFLLLLFASYSSFNAGTFFSSSLKLKFLSTNAANWKLLFICQCFTYGNETACTVGSSDGQGRYAEIRFVWIGWH